MGDKDSTPAAPAKSARRKAGGAGGATEAAASAASPKPPSSAGRARKRPPKSPAEGSAEAPAATPAPAVVASPAETPAPVPKAKVSKPKAKPASAAPRTAARASARGASAQVPATAPSAPAPAEAAPVEAAPIEAAPVEAAPVEAGAEAGLGALPAPPPVIELPAARGRDLLAVVARDPESIFLYWEVTGEGLARAQASLGEGPARLTLRIYVLPAEAGEGAEATRVIDVPIGEWIGRYALTLDQPGARVVASVGLAAPPAEDRPLDFAHLARAAALTLPRRGPGREPVRFSRVPEAPAAPAGAPALPQPLPTPEWVGEVGWLGSAGGPARIDRLPEGFGGPVPEYLAVGVRKAAPREPEAAPPAGSHHLVGGSASGRRTEGEA